MKKQLHLPLLLGGLLLLGACWKEPMQNKFVPTAISSNSTRVVEDEFEGRPLVVVGNRSLDFAVCYFNETVDGKSLSFQVVQDRLPVVMEDQEGNRWDVWGEAVAGPRTGQRLQPARTMTAYWFAWGAFYPGCEIYAGALPEAPAPPEGEDGWLIPGSLVRRGALPGAIPALNTGNYYRNYSQQPEYLKASDYVLAIRLEDEVYLFPEPILQWHEIVNDVQHDIPFSVLYCPLTGSGSALIRSDSSVNSQLEVSGLLYNSNLLASDKGTNSHWSQMLQQCVEGAKSGKTWNTIQVIETTFDGVDALFKGHQTLSDATGYYRDYGNFPYGVYCTNNEKLNFPLYFDDPRLPRKDRVFGVVINGVAKTYPMSLF
ncbi:MAG: DUF3179 domain-containing protein [Lewinellaceae bacterium]|nr:DUF3179 domain-containing protein [Lewinellaceae bacterium]